MLVLLYSKLFYISRNISSWENVCIKVIIILANTGGKYGKRIKGAVLNTTAEGGTLTKWLKSEGEGVKAGEIVYEAEILKVTLEMEAEEDFVLKKILVNEGETINEGMSLAVGSPFIRSGTSTSPSTSISRDS